MVHCSEWFTVVDGLSVNTFPILSSFLEEDSDEKESKIAMMKMSQRLLFFSKTIKCIDRSSVVLYCSGSQTVRRDAPVRRFNFPKASRDILVLCH